MKNFIIKSFLFLIPVFTFGILTGCAAGAATAGYSLKAQSADSLTAAAEQKIIDRAKNEIYYELSIANQCRDYQGR